MEPHPQSLNSFERANVFHKHGTRAHSRGLSTGQEKRWKIYLLTCIPKAMMKGQKCNYQPDYKHTNKIDVQNKMLSSRKREREWAASISFCIGREKVKSKMKSICAKPNAEEKKANIESLKGKTTENSLSVHDFFILLNWFFWQPSEQRPTKWTKTIPSNANNSKYIQNQIEWLIALLNWSLWNFLVCLSMVVFNWLAHFPLDSYHAEYRLWINNPFLFPCSWVRHSSNICPNEFLISRKDIC